MSLQMASLRAWFWSSCLAGMIPGESRSSRFCSGCVFRGEGGKKQHGAWSNAWGDSGNSPDVCATNVLSIDKHQFQEPV